MQNILLGSRNEVVSGRPVYKGIAVPEGSPLKLGGINFTEPMVSQVGDFYAGSLDSKITEIGLPIFHDRLASQTQVGDLQPLRIVSETLASEKNTFQRCAI